MNYPLNLIFSMARFNQNTEENTNTNEECPFIKISSRIDAIEKYLKF